MITIIHGEDVQKSRDFFMSLKKGVVNPISLDGTTITSEQLSQVLQGNDLFESTNDIFIEELITKNKMIVEVEKMIENTSLNIYLWESKQLTAKQLSYFSKKTVHLFKHSVLLFKFLDEVKPGKGLPLIHLLRTLMLQEEDQLIFFMLVRHIRILLALKHPGKNPIEEVKKITPWQLSKLKKQASLFSTEHLIYIYDQLFSLDCKQKSGSLTSSFSEHLDFIILQI